MDPLARALLSWFAVHGRKDLPWQHDPSAYRVWVSEIMLQQTQVTTVIGYYQRFMQRFPDLDALASAPLDDVLHHWSGLGYYARARNLHKAANVVRDKHKSLLPTTLDELTALPGIGRSTAGAILALASKQRHAILDGNVKRVLSRYHGVEGWAGRASVLKRLWTLAEQHTPDEEVASYTQAIMDLGATVCTRSRPRCDNCPLQGQCRAYELGTPTQFPTAKPKVDKPTKHTVFLVVLNHNDQVLLEQRPPSGIWGGLWGFPECAPADDPGDALACQLSLRANFVSHLPEVAHGFTHYRLNISPVLLRLADTATGEGSNLKDDRSIWYDLNQPPKLGLAAPVATLLASLKRLGDTNDP